MAAAPYVAKGGSEISLNLRGWIEVRWGALVDKDEYVDIGHRMYDFVTAMEDDAQVPKMLIDFSRMEEITPEAAAFASQATKALACEKIAGYGIKTKFKGALDAIKIRSTRQDAIREFETREEAEAWLLEA